MVANRIDWPVVLSKELPEGLSSSGRENASEATTSLSGQVAPNGWRVIISSMAMWRESSNGLDDITVEEFLDCFEPSQIAASPGFWTFRNRDNFVKLVEGLTSSNRGWKDGQNYYFVIPLVPNLALSSLPLSKVMKINKNKLKNMVEKGVPMVTIGLKRKKIDEGQLSIPLEQSGPSVKKASVIQVPLPIPQTPQVVQISYEEIAVVQLTDGGSTICQSHGLAAKRVEAAITELDFEEYDNAQTENISKLMVHSPMREKRDALEELEKVKVDLAAKDGNKKRDALEELEKVKVDLAAKDGDIKTAVDARDGAVKEMKHLMSQIEGARVAAVSEYQAFEAFEDNNLRFFYSGLEAFRKQAKERYPEVDFSAFQPYDNTEFVNDEGRIGDGGDQADDAMSEFS
uniref:Uncharacterized protein n=1 Tax=Fagus sylvatica TaxID=28930 RepID=A0A2N9GD64_FAGSY